MHALLDITGCTYPSVKEWKLTYLEESQNGLKFSMQELKQLMKKKKI